jgi:hypothetical protein
MIRPSIPSLRGAGGVDIVQHLRGISQFVVARRPKQAVTPGPGSRRSADGQRFSFTKPAGRRAEVDTLIAELEKARHRASS